ncbi:MAG: CtsR family transcriptional regulator [Clostridia bacterium]|nr:CtsR family transcriptional regulator [Clostridia bacterium]
MRLSEVIEEYIKALMGDSDEFVEFGRNELAEYFNCVPSQINYVISTRFSPERGYYVESKRGGGGNIKIKRIDITKDRYIMHLINSIDTSLSQQEAEIIIKNLQGYNIIDSKTAKLLKVTTNDKVLGLPKEYRDDVRTRIFKNILINLI